MAKKREAKPTQQAGILEVLAELRPYVLPVLLVTFVVLSALVAWQRFDRFFSNDPRFLMRRADFGQEHSPDLAVKGIRHTNVAEVRRAFAADEGKSVYLLPLEERRQRLRQLEWIKDASVQRLWPNRIAVDVEERMPVYRVELASLRRRGITRLATVDGEGKLLPNVDHGDLSKTPVMSGIHTGMEQREVADRVRLMGRVIEELGSEGRAVTEIDVSDVDNVKLVYPVQSQGKERVITLVVGDTAWRQRLLKFLANWPEVEKRMPRAVKLDLRIDGRINAVGFEEPQRAGSEEAKETQRAG
ncbi:MAG: FtsQ-type POTRA domain-containing protein [Acidobacteria bacterium]|nr:FtsQ-type POTRA domain-containing protein [Acidobacteriota bacterium]